MEVVHIAKGKRLFKQGDVGVAAYIVTSGAIGLYREGDGGKFMLATIRKGELFGEMAVIDGSPRMATAFALFDSTLGMISADQIAEKMRSADPFVRSLVQMQTNNLRNVHNAYAPRSRSVRDAVSMIATQRDILNGFLGGHRDTRFRAGLAAHLNSLDIVVKELQKLVAAHPNEDRREDAMLHGDENQDRP
jgi:CRP-like cAMP-binding protein